MTPYATAADLVETATFYGLTPPPAADRERLLALAEADIVRHLGAVWDPDVLPPAQNGALRQATAVQALFRAEQGPEAVLGLDDGLASVGPLAFSLHRPPRLSPEAVDLLAGLGLFTRSGTVLPELPDAAA